MILDGWQAPRFGVAVARRGRSTPGLSRVKCRWWVAAFEVMEPSAVRDIRVLILYGHFVLRDVWCDAGDDGESLTAAQQDGVVGASTYHLTVRALSHWAGLRLRLWSADPGPDRGAWDGGRELELHCPTGELSVDQITAGAAAEVTLPGGAGVYGVRVHWKDREAAAEEITRVYAERGHEPFDVRYDALRQVDGTEKFLVDLWWQAALPPADDDEDFYGDLWS